ncbi:MAG: hypothetical protein ACSHX0_05875 [Akkermansiaceae bacterium]
MINIFTASLIVSQCNFSLAQEILHESSPYIVTSMRAGATWTSQAENFVYDSNGTHFRNRALLYSEESIQSEDGFVITVEYTTGSIGNLAAHNLSFGLISDETNLYNYTGYNPFSANPSVYSIGVNITADNGVANRGMNFADGNEVISLDQSGTNAQFVAGESTKVTIEIGIGGSWTYRINDVYEDSGVITDFDLDKFYHLAVYAQDDHGGGKSIQSISMRKNYAAGERADKLRGTWSSGIDVSLMDAVSHLKTLDSFGVSFTSGAVQSAMHNAPHKLMERLALEGADGNDSPIDLLNPTWGNLNHAEPDVDKVMDDMLKVIDAGFNVKAYTNCENFVGSNTDDQLAWVERWFEWCDTNSEAQAFINSQPYHTGVWNRTTQQYEDATNTYPFRKYMFCYAEFILKDHALRYGQHISSWIFDDGGTMGQNGDNATSGLIEEQRIYQAYADAVHAGNPAIPVAFNNSRSTLNYASYPFAHAVRFEDFTFGHAFGGNNNHANKIGNQFNLNYRHITRMTETDGYVHDGGNWDWDDKIVGNFHSKLSTTAWKYGPAQAWEQDDFNQWTLEALESGGAMLWDGSYNRSVTTLYGWVVPMLESLDNHLYQNGVSINTFVPDPDKEYHIDNVSRNVRVSATGNSEDAYTQSTSFQGVNTRWKFVAKGNGHWHIQRSNGGSVPRLRADTTVNADMDATSSNGGWTYYEFTPSTTADGAYYITLPDGPAGANRLNVNSSGAVRFVDDSFDGTAVSFKITEAN